MNNYKQKLGLVIIIIFTVIGCILVFLPLNGNQQKEIINEISYHLPTPVPTSVPEIPIIRANDNIEIHLGGKNKAPQAAALLWDNNSTKTINHISQIIPNPCPYLPDYSLLSGLPKPEFCMIGVAKGGSTSFSNYLPIHPNVNSIEVKEPNFWSYKHIATDKYQNMFVNINPINLNNDKVENNINISGEYSTSYIVHPLVPKRMYSHLPNIKIILFLRNPIDRAYSHYIMSLRGSQEIHPFEKIIKKEMEEIDYLRYQLRYCFNSDGCNVTDCFPDYPLYKHDKPQTPFMFLDDIDIKDYFFKSYLFRSIYDDQVERWFNVYPKDQILVLSSEYFYDNTILAMNEITEFLNLPPYDYAGDPIFDKSWGGGPSNTYEVPHSYEPMNNQTREILKQFFAPYNERLFKILGKSFDWN